MTDAGDAWAPLEAAVRADPPLRRLFELEPDRATRLTFEACSLTLDLSKQPWSAASFANALDLARAAGLEAAREALFAGEAVNASEGRAALHMVHDLIRPIVHVEPHGKVNEAFIRSDDPVEERDV